MRLFPSFWSGISGFLDDQRNIEEKVYDELFEEAGIEKRDILSFHQGITLTQEDTLHGKTWMVHPVVVEVRSEEVLLDWESEAYAWVTVDEAKRYETLPGFFEVLQALEPYLIVQDLHVYRHMKGGLYRLLFEASHTDDESTYVVYESVLDGKRWVRPREEFFGTVERDGKKIRRFSPVIPNE